MRNNDQKPGDRAVPTVDASFFETGIGFVVGVNMKIPSLPFFKGEIHALRMVQRHKHVSD